MRTFYSCGCACMHTHTHATYMYVPRSRSPQGIQAGPGESGIISRLHCPVATAEVRGTAHRVKVSRPKGRWKTRNHCCPGGPKCLPAPSLGREDCGWVPVTLGPPGCRAVECWGVDAWRALAVSGGGSIRTPISSGTGLSNQLVLEEITPPPTERPFLKACKLRLCGRQLSGESPHYAAGEMESFTFSLHWSLPCCEGFLAPSLIPTAKGSGSSFLPEQGCVFDTWCPRNMCPGA